MTNADNYFARSTTATGNFREPLRLRGAGPKAAAAKVFLVTRQCLHSVRNMGSNSFLLCDHVGVKNTKISRRDHVSAEKFVEACSYLLHGLIL
jgi:hypothetical protein